MRDAPSVLTPDAASSSKRASPSSARHAASAPSTSGRWAGRRTIPRRARSAAANPNSIAAPSWSPSRWTATAWRAATCIDSARRRPISLRRADHDREPIERRGRIAAGELDGGADDVDALDIGPVVVDVRVVGERERFGVAAEGAERLAAQQAQVDQHLVRAEQVLRVSQHVLPTAGRCGDAGLDLAGHLRTAGRRGERVVQAFEHDGVVAQVARQPGQLDEVVQDA